MFDLTDFNALLTLRSLVAADPDFTPQERRDARAAAHEQFSARIHDPRLTAIADRLAHQDTLIAPEAPLGASAARDEMEDAPVQRPQAGHVAPRAGRKARLSKD